MKGPAAGATTVQRHLTAIRRNQLSRPVRLALRDGVLTPNSSIFDYGCGRGEDVEYLKGMGFKASGWDPVHFDQGKVAPADVVNLGYVINVIEISSERKETLKKAYKLAGRALVVSAQVGYFDEQIARSTEFEDGYLTSRNTFQKYFEQEELRDYIRDTLGQEPYPAGIGIYYVFKDAELESAYCRRLYEDALPAAFNTQGLQLSLSADTLQQIAAHVRQLGRLPEPSEAPTLAPAIAILSASEAWLQRLKPYLPVEEAQAIAVHRRRMLAARLLASYFGGLGKLRMCDLSESERADLRCFFGSYVRATQSVEEIYDQLKARLDDQAAESEWQLAAAPELLPDAHYYLMHCLASAVQDASWDDAEQVYFQPGTLNLRWQTATQQGHRYWVYDAAAGSIGHLEGPEQPPGWPHVTTDTLSTGQFHLLSRAQKTGTRPARPRGVPPEVLEQFIAELLSKGRIPQSGETKLSKPEWAACLRYGWQLQLSESGRAEAYEQARRICWEKVLYQVGTSLFRPGGRPQFRKWEEDFQLDIRGVFRSYAQACAESDSWMRRMGDAQYVESELRGAGKGRLHPEKGLYFHRSLLAAQPLVLRLIVETAAQWGAGEMPPSWDVVRLSHSGDIIKFYQYEDFEQHGASRLTAYCKVAFRRRKIYGYVYGTSAREPKLLTTKSDLVSPDYPCWGDFVLYEQENGCPPAIEECAAT